MDWQQFLEDFQSALGTGWEWVKKTAEDCYSYAEPIIERAAEWIRDKSLAGLDWVRGIFQLLWLGEFSRLSGLDILLLVLILMVLIALLSRAVRSLFREQLEQEDSVSRGVLYEGRWTVHGYQQPFKAEQRRRAWQKKVMSPKEQQRYVEQVQANGGAHVVPATRARRPWRKLWRVLLIPICVYAATHYLVPEWGKNRKTLNAAPVAPPAPTFDLLGTVVKVKDGDSIIVSRDKDASIEVRLHGIDAPEYKQAHGKKARRVLANLVSGEAVGLVVKDTDRFGRAVAVVYVDGENINLEMVCAGHAWWYERYAAENIDMKKCQHRARSSGLGLWADRNPVPPWEWRR